MWEEETTVTKKTYSKKDIIELARKYGELENEPTQTTLEKRLDKIIEFLQGEKVQYVLEQQSDKDSGAYFYNNEMNLTKAKGDAFKEYNYTLIDAIFLAVLISLSNQSFFKTLTSKKSKIINPKLEERQWIDAFTNKLSRFETVWGENDNRNSWEVVSVNLGSLFYRLTLLPKMSAHAEELQSKVYILVKLFEELPDHHKIEFYNKAMKNVLGKLEEYIKSLKETNPDEYLEYELHKRLVEIDRQLDTEDDLEKYLQKLKEIHSDK